MTKIDEDEIIRRMVCPFCGFKCEDKGIGAMYCGPHRSPDGSYNPAVQMIPNDEGHMK